jgi:hypothetical protein
VRAALVLPFAAALAGCGTNRPEIPEELLRAPDAPATADYPDGPYGVDKGAVVANAEFRGYREPLRSDLSEGELETVSFADYYDPAGRRYELLLINTAALWCSVCQSEHSVLPERYAEYSARGLMLVSALFQDERTDPADLGDLRLWIRRFDVPFPMLLDPDFQLGAYATAETAPLNLLVDARTMTIIEKFIGDSGTTLWQLVEGELARREAAD